MTHKMAYISRACISLHRPAEPHLARDWTSAGHSAHFPQKICAVSPVSRIFDRSSGQIMTRGLFIHADSYTTFFAFCRRAPAPLGRARRFASNRRGLWLLPCCLVLACSTIPPCSRRYASISSLHSLVFAGIEPAPTRLPTAPVAISPPASVQRSLCASNPTPASYSPSFSPAL